MGLRPDKKHRIIQESGGICFLCCGALQKSETTIHHVVPKALGGTNAAENLVAAHAGCNLKAGDRLPTQLEFERLLVLKKQDFDAIPRDSILRKLLKLSQQRRLSLEKD